MSWFWRKRTVAPTIPKFREPERPAEKKPEPMIVEENFDPSESAILRVKGEILRRWRGE